MGTVGRGAIVERGKKNGWKKKKRRKVQEKVLKTEKGPKRGQEIRKNKATNKEQIGVIVKRAGIIRVKRKKVKKVDMVAKSA